MWGLGLGDLPAWINAIAAVLALVAASIGAYYAIRVLRIEYHREQESARERRRSQASRISAWLEWRKTPGAELLVVMARNASELPAYGISFELLDPTGRVLAREDLDLLPPDDVPRELVLLPSAGSTLPSNETAAKGLRVRLIYRDAAGLYWIRDVSGTLIEMLHHRGSEALASSQPEPQLLESNRQIPIDLPKARTVDTDKIGP